MAGVAVTQYRLGAKSLNRQQLQQILQILGINDPNQQLPVDNCNYCLVLEAKTDVPEKGKLPHTLT